MGMLLSLRSQSPAPISGHNRSDWRQNYLHVGTLRCDGDGFRAVAFTLDGMLLASCSGTTIQLWDTRTWILSALTSDVSRPAIQRGAAGHPCQRLIHPQAR